MRIAVTGGQGQLGWALSRCDNRDLQIVTLAHTECDITRYEHCQKALENVQCDAVINAAAYTLVDAAESNRELAFKVNEQGAANVARICQQHQLPLIHISTDYVFAGIDAQSASEDDATQPLNVYGQSKLAGESAVLDENAEATIVRTSAIFSAHGHNFAKTILRLAEAKRSINVITDQITCPTAATHLADVILTMLTAKTRGGVYHYCDGPAVSWFDFANAIIAEAKQQNRCQQVTVIPITSNEYKTSARRPQHSVLNCEKIHNDFQISQQHWQTTLASLIEQVCNYDG